MIRRLALVLALLVGASVAAAPPASAASRFYCRVDNSVPAANSTKSFKDACLKHLKAAGFRGLTITEFHRCKKRDDCLLGTDQVNITATRKRFDGLTEELGFIAITWTRRR